MSILIQNTPSASDSRLGSPQDPGQSLGPAGAHWHQHLCPHGHPRLTVRGARLKGTTSSMGGSVHKGGFIWQSHSFQKLTQRLQGKKIYISGGVVSPAVVKLMKASSQVWCEPSLPAWGGTWFYSSCYLLPPLFWHTPAALQEQKTGSLLGLSSGWWGLPAPHFCCELKHYFSTIGWMEVASQQGIHPGVAMV